jgi:DNA-binding NarL/FixJ family response regulator
MDLRLPGVNGADALITIRGEFPQARIIILTTSDCDGAILVGLGRRFTKVFLN